MTRHRLQQQPLRPNDRQQQQSSGSNEFQPRRAQQGAEARTHQAGEHLGRQGAQGSSLASQMEVPS